MHFISTKHQCSALQWPLEHLEHRAKNATKIQIGVKEELTPQKITSHNGTLKHFLCHLKSLPAQSSPDSFV